MMFVFSLGVELFFFFFFNDTATTEIYTLHIVGSVRCVQETGTWDGSNCQAQQTVQERLFEWRLQTFQTNLAKVLNQRLVLSQSNNFSVALNSKTRSENSN
eukprot:TRINITY_DN2688_c0_g2_i2.p3 TRINITY_DN2688_c0_g2~~TRINITY_DN2688_c0_g2_i2.p3  ORF type:complete len:101 (-),score=28.29 TRINITY_DN2688_c0_g2_i2:216-518(-)